MTYPGGKGASGVYQRLINLMPPHSVYVEPFLGGGSVMRLKRPASMNIGLDLDAGVVARAASSIPGRCDAAGDSVIRSDGGRWIWLVGDAVEYLSSTGWEGDELIYCDPPYMHETGSAGHRYAFEMDCDQHRVLLSVICSLPCMVMISGYWTELYARTLSDWSHSSFQAMTRGGRMATEHVWFNYRSPVALHDYRYLGDTFRERERLKRKIGRWAQRLAAMPTLERQALLSALVGLAENSAASSEPAMEASHPGANAGGGDTAWHAPTPHPAMPAAAASTAFDDASCARQRPRCSPARIAGKAAATRS